MVSFFTIFIIRIVSKEHNLVKALMESFCDSMRLIKKHHITMNPTPDNMNPCMLIAKSGEFFPIVQTQLHNILVLGLEYHQSSSTNCFQKLLNFI